MPCISAAHLFRDPTKVADTTTWKLEVEVLRRCDHSFGGGYWRLMDRGG